MNAINNLLLKITKYDLDVYTQALSDRNRDPNVQWRAKRAGIQNDTISSILGLYKRLIHVWGQELVCSLDV